MSQMLLLDNQWHRLYLTAEERIKFADAAKHHCQHDNARTFCRILYFTGCRVSEALELTSDHIDFANGCITFRTLKKRKQKSETKQYWRNVPVPASFLDELNMIHKLKKLKQPISLWPVTRQAAWGWCKRVMNEIGLSGVHATAKGLRHAFWVAAVMNGVPLPTLQKWMGHADIQTTAHYLQIVGTEEQELAARMWE